MVLLSYFSPSDGFMPHGYCYLWNPGLVWLHVISDSLIALAYLSIPITLLYFARKKRGLPFSWIFVCFGVFIVACGATHILEVWNLWHANYWIAGVLKASTALASIVTAVLLVRLAPQALTLPSHEDLGLANDLRISLATEVAKLGVWEWDLAAKRSTWNATMFEIYGLEPVNPVRYEKWSASIHPEDLPALEDALQTLIREKSEGGQEFRIRLANGAVRDISAVERVFLDARGKATRMIGVNFDVTERKRAEEALRTSEEQFRHLAETIREVFFIQTPEPIRMAYISPAYDEIWGRPRQELYDRPALWIESVVVKDRELASRAFAECMQGLATDIEFRVTRPDDSIRWIHARSFPVFDSKGKFIRAVGIAEDITERRRVLIELQSAREAAEAASRVKGEFLANMSHELRTPLNGIMGMTELALDTDLTSEQREYLSMVKTSSDSLLTVINDILDFSKIEAGKLDFESVEFNFRGSVEATMKALAMRAHEKELDLNCRVRPEVPAVLVGDPSRLRQIIVNLVGNAIKFTERGEVTLDVQEESDEPGSALLHFSVEDSGIGIALEKQATIFDAFTQADGSTARRYGGSGLGLTISRRLGELFGGRLWLGSAPGRGSTFHFTARFAVVADSGEPPPLQTVNLGGVPVLVVDDNATSRLILEEMLTGWRMNSTLVGDAAEALEQINRAADAGRPFRLVLVDAAMPEADGFTLVEQLTKDSRLAAEKVVMMISVGQRGDAARSRDLGVAAYLTKPVAHAELLDAILRVLDISSRPAAPSSFAIHSLQESK
jgi:PAS domain S-box-containing protein